jgi:probable phosphoglycerate mutase
VELVAVRHGRTEWNATGRFQGHSDVPLDAVGVAHAHALANLLANERIDFAVSSDLSRAKQTAQILLAPHRIEPALDARWREMNFGAWEGLTWEEIVARDPTLAPSDVARPRVYAPPGGESFERLCERVAAALAALRSRAPADARVLVATHAGPLHALLRVAVGEAADHHDLRFAPASITRLRFAGDTAEVVCLNAGVGDAPVSYLRWKT